MNNKSTYSNKHIVRVTLIQPKPINWLEFREAKTKTYLFGLITRHTPERYKNVDNWGYDSYYTEEDLKNKKWGYNFVPLIKDKKVYYPYSVEIVFVNGYKFNSKNIYTIEEAEKVYKHYINLMTRRFGNFESEVE